jgi:hypothetical protein
MDHEAERDITKLTYTMMVIELGGRVTRWFIENEVGF